MNEDEAKEYAQASTVLEAGEFLLSKGAAYAVVKQGEYLSLIHSYTTASGEDYLEAILVLQKKMGMVRSVDIARHLSLINISVIECNTLVCYHY